MNTENNEKQEEKKNDEQSQTKFDNSDQKIKIFVIDTGKIKQTKAFARQDGTLLGIVWVASFVCTMLAAEPEYQMLGLFSNLLILSTPFVVAKRLKYFRDVVREGHISFKHGLYYCVQTFFYATLLLTIVQYLWFRFMNTGMFMTQLQSELPDDSPGLSVDSRGNQSPLRCHHDDEAYRMGIHVYDHRPGSRRSTQSDSRCYLFKETN